MRVGQELEARAGLWAALAAAVERWRFRAEGGRDPRLDFLRGLCIVILTINHIGEQSPLRFLAGDGKFIVSAAEGFVFISGLLFGIVYGRIAAVEGMGAVWRKALRRALSLYLVMLGGTTIMVVMAALEGIPWIASREPGAVLGLLWQIATLQASFRLTRILLMYSLLLAVAPVSIWLLRSGRPWLLLALAWGLWAVYQVAPRLAGWPMGHMTLFNPAAWQLLFVHAIVIGHYRGPITAFFTERRRLLLLGVSAAALALLIPLYLTRGAFLAAYLPFDVADWVEKLFARGPLRPGRLLAVAALFPLVYLLLTYCWQPLYACVGPFLVMLGSNSLYCYAVHLPFVALAYLTQPLWGEAGLPMLLGNALVQAGSLAAISALVRHRAILWFIPR